MAQPAAEKATPLFALPLTVSDYQTDYVIHDARWRRIAAFPRKQERSRERAEALANALNQSPAFAALVETARAVTCGFCSRRVDSQELMMMAKPCNSCAPLRAALAQIEKGEG